MKKIMVSLAVALLLVTAIPTFASSGKTVTVTNYDDLYMAVDSASDCDTIIIADAITIEWGIFLGDSSKTITLKRSGDGCIEVRNDSGEYWNIFFVNLIFDCQGVDAGKFFVNNAENVDVIMDGCTFINTGTSDITEEPTESTEQPSTEEPTESPSTDDDIDSKQEQTDPPATDENGKEDAGQKENESQDTGTTVTTPTEEDSKDSGTQQAPTNSDTGTTVAPDAVVNAEPSTATENAPQSTASETAVIASESTEDSNTGSDASVQNVPVTITIEPQQAQTEVDASTTVNVNEQPVTFPDASGTVTINIYVDSSNEQNENGQAVKSESLTGTSEPSLTVTQAVDDAGAGVDVLEVVQTVLIACILVCMVYDIRHNGKGLNDRVK